MHNKRLKLVLCQPSRSLHKCAPTQPLFCSMPLCIATIASYVRENTDAEVVIHDGYLHGYSSGDWEALLRREQPDVFGISSTTDLIYDAYKLAKISKSILPGTLVVVGGTHARVRAREIVENENVDIVCFGEGEIIVKKILDSISGSFQDSTFLINKKRIIELCKLIIERKIKIQWSCSSRVDTIPDSDILKLMKKSGCNMIFLGVESGNDDILARIKNVTKEKVIRACKQLKEVCIGVHCVFILGLPGDNRETIWESIRFAVRLNPDTVSFNVAVPYPGSKMYEQFRKGGQILHEVWSEYTKKPVIDLGHGLNPDALQELRIKALRTFYLRPLYIIGRFRQLDNLGELYNYARVFLSLMFSKIPKYI